MEDDREKKRKLLLQYAALAGERELKRVEMEGIERELGLSPEQALKEAQDLLLSGYNH